MLAVGDCPSLLRVLDSLIADIGSGLRPIGVCTSHHATSMVSGVPIVGGLVDARSAAVAGEADLVVVVPSRQFGEEEVRLLRWSLEGSGTRLAVASASPKELLPLTDVARSRIWIRRVRQSALAYVEEPNLGRGREWAKRFADCVLAVLGLAVTWPLLLLIAGLIKWDSKGPALFKQARVGRNGETFLVWKFRSMGVGSEELAEQLAEANESDGLLFKMKADPRVTRVGSWLRRWSLDEVPQLFNILRGEMSLIGPRPLPVPPESFRGAERRRLLVKPGLTGLWQVSGRSDTSWEEAVRLDIYYVENWSIWLDLNILRKTVFAVLNSDGAY